MAPRKYLERFGGAALVLLLVLAFARPAAAQRGSDEPTGPVLRLEAIEIRGEVSLPTAIISLSRRRPVFKPTTLEKDISREGLNFDLDLLRPSEQDLVPKKMDDLKALLAKERR